MNGMSQEKFVPNGILTRGQLVTILHLLGRQPDTHRSQPLHRREGGTVLHRGGELGSRAGAWLRA